MKKICNDVRDILKKLYQSNNIVTGIKEKKIYKKFNRSFKKYYPSTYLITSTSECLYRQTYYNDMNKIFVSLSKQKDLKKLKEYYKELDNDKVYSDEYFENRMSMRVIAKHICRNVPKDNLILDVACGHGAIDIVLSKKGYKVTGIDLNSNRINTLKENIFKALCIDLESMYEDIQYDVIIALEMLEHVPDILQSLKKIYKMLRGGGLLYVSVPNEWQIDDEQHIRIFNKDSIIKLMNLAGLQVINVSTMPYLNHERDNDLVCVATKP